MDEMIRINGLTKDYGSGRGVFGLDLSIAKGEICGLVGTNGSGKTTTMRHLMGFLRPDSGSCSIAGLDCRRSSDKIMKLVGYVPGQIDFPDVGSGTSFLKLQAEYLGVRDMDYTNELIDRFKIDTSAPLKRMSKGMKQKMALVAAFMSKPDVLLLDEPSTGLDPVMRDELINLINEQKQRGATVFMSSHVFKELQDTCDRVVFIHDGKLIDQISHEAHTDELPKLYRLGFADSRQYREFAASAPFEIESRNDRFSHLTVSVGSSELNELIVRLSGYDMRYVRCVPYTLEMYYKKYIEQGGIA